MNTETGDIYPAKTKEQQKIINDLIAQGDPIVPVSDKVAAQQRAGKIAMTRAQSRTRSRSKYMPDGSRTR